MARVRGTGVALVAAVALLACACVGETRAPAGSIADGADDHANLLGAGATFPSIVYQAWFYRYNNQIASGVRINYQSVGSGAGVEQFIADTVDFGATDTPMDDATIARAPDVVHLPTVMGAVVVTYSLPGLTKPLRLDGLTTGAIFLGEIVNWNDPAIAALNRGVTLPDEMIHVVHRSDGSGTSDVFTDWLSKVSPHWKAQVGRGKAPAWPVGIGGQGNEGLTQVVSQTPGAIGYVELNFAVTQGLAFADIENSAGTFVTASVDSVTAAAASADIPADYRVSITDAAGADSYPVSTFTYLLMHHDGADCTRERVLLRTLWWAYHDPSAIAETRSLLYAPLPPALQARVDATITSMTCEGGKAIFDR
jgi:phosphate transport system substrate-binding protein